MPTYYDENFGHWNIEDEGDIIERGGEFPCYGEDGP